ncbi:transglycosylase domain-containing protein [Shouchella lonarensis]|uniref:Penicillin-binding protein n=1 Tax=Shouchella lonarensis TaxID=1464122 RepID=A0A1G6GGZ9_9BACI|nr:transglycosylase domain-containing protein [Shouchella lonarensis]SDB81267.1 penicillin-binding protein [Shouchella lonarensis]
MKEMLAKCRHYWHTFMRKLARIQFFRKVEITYQVLWNLCLIAIITGFLSLVFAGAVAAGYFASLVKDEIDYNENDMVALVENLTETSKIYWAGEQFLGNLRSDLQRERVSLDNIAEEVKWAIIATEDEHFYEHDGIVPKALLRATLQELSNSSVQTGGSTLTQQLVKQQILSSEVSFDRKASEVFLSLRLEHFMSKDEILEAYLNVVPFGRNANGTNIAGIETAAQGVFGVSAKELNLPQAAYLAGMPQSPFGYTPFTKDGQLKDENGMKPGFKRLETVLERLHEKGYITDEQYAEASNYDLTADFAKKAPDSMQEYPRLTTEITERATDVLVKQKIAARKGWDDLSDSLKKIERDKFAEEAKNELVNQGYKVYTTIDHDLYKAMNEAAASADHLFEPDRGGIREELGAVLLHNQTGAILSFVGGRREELEKWEVNHATSPRQAGSTMKPILAYGPAIEAGVTQPGLVIPDTEMSYRNGKTIGNAGRAHAGNVSVRESLVQSYNVPAVRASDATPVSVKEKVIANAGLTSANFSVEKILGIQSAPLGSVEITVEQNASAFSTFANNGVRHEPYMIERIETSTGEVVYEHEDKQYTVFSPQTSYLVTDMLRGVMKSGATGATAGGNIFYADWASKTGTTNDNKDSLFVATNPNITLALWNGFSGKQLPLNPTYGGGTGPRTQKIWARLAHAAYNVNPSLMSANGKRFTQPGGLTRRSVCAITGGPPSKACEALELVTSDLYASHMVGKIDGLSPFQAQLKQQNELEKIEKKQKEEEENDGDTSDNAATEENEDNQEDGEVDSDVNDSASDND